MCGPPTALFNARSTHIDLSAETVSLSHRRTCHPLCRTDNASLPLTYQFSDLDLTVGHALAVSKGFLYTSVVNDMSAVVDDIPYVFDAYIPNNVPGSLDVPIAFEIFKSFQLTLTFCNKLVGLNGTHWNHLWYDPTLGIAFGAPTNPSTPVSPRLKRQNVGAIIGGAISAVACIGIVAALIVSYKVSPAFRKVISPFSNRGAPRQAQQMASQHMQQYEAARDTQESEKEVAPPSTWVKYRPDPS